MLINTCHECFPRKIKENNDNSYEGLKNNIKYEGSSPDEICLLNSTKNNFGIFLSSERNNIM